MLFLETRSLCKYYRTNARIEVRALDNVSLGIERGSLTVVSGPSGSGKTTLLALLGALERPTRGQVFFAGSDLGDCSGMELARVRRRLGFIFQDFALIPNLTAEENITYPLIPRGVARAERQRRARELLARFGLEEKRTVRAASPQRRRAATGRHRARLGRTAGGGAGGRTDVEPRPEQRRGAADDFSGASRARENGGAHFARPRRNRLGHG